MRAKFRPSILFISLPAALSVASPGCHSAVPVLPREPSSRPSGLKPLDAEYAHLSRDVTEYHGTPPRMDGWTLNTEHLFLGSDDPFELGGLRQRAIRFSRITGALNLLFGKLASPMTSAEEALVLTEILVFYGSYDVAGDEAIEASAAVEAERLLKGGAFADLDKKFDAPVQRMLTYALDKALRRVPPRRPTNELWAK